MDKAYALVKLFPPGPTTRQPTHPSTHTDTQRISHNSSTLADWESTRLTLDILASSAPFGKMSNLEPANFVPFRLIFYWVLMSIPALYSGPMIKIIDAAPAPSPESLATTLSSTITPAAVASPTTPASLPNTLDPLSVRISSVTQPISGLGSTVKAASATPSTTQTSIASESATTPLPSHTLSYGWESEKGGTYGNIIIQNRCNETFNLWSVGAWPLGGFRNDSLGWTTEQDTTMHVVEPGTNYSEPYRVTCPPAKNHTEGYCYDYDKLRGQGVAIKISRNESVAADLLQLEYALLQNPLDGDEYHKLYYDVSLLDCAAPENIATSDVSATTEQYQDKIHYCPGYKNGLAVTFHPDPGLEVCKSINCPGEEKPICTDIYNYDRSRLGEASMACQKKFQGNMILQLCVRNQ